MRPNFSRYGTIGIGICCLFGISIFISHAQLNSRLKVAVEEGDDRQVMALLDGGADANAKNSSGNPMLHYAGNADVAELLLNQGAKLEAQGGNGWTALDVAAHDGNLEVVKYLLKREAKANSSTLDAALLMNFRFYSPDIVAILKLLVENGVDINGPCYMTPLQYAAMHSDLQFAKYSIAKGANVDILWGRNWNLLHLAAASEKIDSDIAQEYRKGRISLPEPDNPEIARFFIAKGIPVNAVSTERETPLHIAVWKNNFRIAQVLMKHGANPLIKNKKGLTPAGLASKVYSKDSPKTVRKWMRILKLNPTAH